MESIPSLADRDANRSKVTQSVLCCCCCWIDLTVLQSEPRLQVRTHLLVDSSEHNPQDIILRCLVLQTVNPK